MVLVHFPLPDPGRPLFATTLLPVPAAELPNAITG